MRRPPRFAASAAVLTAASFAVTALLGTPGAAAEVEVPFAAQFATNVRGGVAVAANTLMTCPEAAANCLESRAGTATGAALSDNAYGMERVDVDADPTTFDSSTATLALPAGASVQFAGLYYGGRTSKGGLGGVEAPNAAARGTVLMRAPGALGYSPLTATVFDSGAITNAYVGFVDVTAQVAAAGSGEYTVADVQAGTGEDRYAGWSLIVVYSDPASPPRSIRVFDGLASVVANEAPLSIPITGLETPLAGTVTAEAGLVAYEGDRGAAGDRLSLGGQNLADAANPANNVFNSSISVAGNDVTTKDPNYVNQLGFDADLIGANGFLANGTKETTLEESTSLDQYLTQAIVVSVELDPSVLEPPVPPPTSAGGSTTPTAETPTKKPVHHGSKGRGGKGGKEEGTPAPTLEIGAPEGVVRPSAVIALDATVKAPAAESLRNLKVCNGIGPGLTRLRAPGATGSGGSVCWHLGKLGAGKKRRFVTTVRVDATGRRTLRSRTVVSARGARTLRRTTRIHVRPLPATACGSSLNLATARLIRPRC